MRHYSLDLFLFVDDAPSVETMRCVPMAWCEASKTKPTQIWNDIGAGGGKPGSMWTINSLNMVAIVTGHDAPKDVYYELRSKRFMVDQYALVSDDGEIVYRV